VVEVGEVFVIGSGLGGVVGVVEVEVVWVGPIIVIVVCPLLWMRKNRDNDHDECI